MDLEKLDSYERGVTPLSFDPRPSPVENEIEIRFRFGEIYPMKDYFTSLHYISAAKVIYSINRGTYSLAIPEHRRVLP